jgi:urea transport system substrate-binding protein
VISTLNGDTNVPFFKEFANAGLTSDNCPVVSFSISEDEFRGLPAKDLVGHLGCWTYFRACPRSGQGRQVLRAERVH